MKAISRWLDRFCYKHPRFGIPNLMKFRRGSGPELFGI